MSDLSSVFGKKVGDFNKKESESLDFTGLKIPRDHNEGLEEDVVYYENIEKILENLPENVKRIWAYVFTEIFNNAIEHSESETINSIVYKNAINVTMFIIDDGIGIFKKIQEYYKYNTLEEAIDELFKGKLTTDKENHSGEGIFFSSKLMDRFLVYSDKKVFTHDNHNEIVGDINDDAILYKISEGKGTVVFMQLENKTHKQLSEIFDMYADVDGGLTRTKIPMKNVFGNAFPVSRSQARRLCNRFDEFKEVILDFSGVEEMGQGFADELFSKYIERNPDIKITVLNENDKIAHMIAHVQKIK